MKKHRRKVKIASFERIERMECDLDINVNWGSRGVTYYTAQILYFTVYRK